MFSRFIHAVACDNTSVLFMAEYSITWIYHILFIHSSVGGHSSSFQFRAIINKASVNISIQIFVWMYIFSSLGHKFRSGIAGSYGTLNLWTSCQTIFHGVWIILHSHQQYRKIPISLHPPHHLLFAVFVCLFVLILTILVGVK